MKNFKKKGFTLIELIAVLVIMAIIALIVTPLVMNIIRKARISADKRSVDAYGRSIELAIAGYLLDTGKFPTSVDQLTIEYSGNKIECTTTQINPDSSVYLSNCKVNNREVTNYTYGTDKSPSYEAYSVGDEVTYNGVDYYVIKDSGTKDNVVTLLKATPLTTQEVNLYGGVGTENNHVNRYTKESQGTAYDDNGYGGMVYYTSETCGYINNNWVETGCTTDYTKSDIKYVIDAWSKDEISSNLLKDSRLIMYNEMILLSETKEVSKPWGNVTLNVFLFDWVYINNHRYNTMSQFGNHNDRVWIIYSETFNSKMSSINDSISINNDVSTVRPVVELYKNDGITRKNSSNN